MQSSLARAVASFCRGSSRQSSTFQVGKQCIDGQTISYVRAGHGPHAVLCLPSSLGSVWTDFAPQLKKLDGDQFSIVAWDPPGCGNSRPPNRDFSPGFFRRDAEMAFKLMTRLELPSFSMMGWSGGGVTALLLAARYPRHVRRCVVWGAASYLTRQDILRYQGIRDTNTWSERMRAPLVAIYGEEYLRTTWNDLVEAFTYLHNTGGNFCVEDLRLISCPCLIIHGEKDPLVPREQPDFLNKNILNSRLHFYPNGKHNIHLQYSEDFNKVVANFLHES